MALPTLLQELDDITPWCFTDKQTFFQESVWDTKRTRNHIGMQRWKCLLCELWLKEEEEKATGRKKETEVRYCDREQFI